MLAASRYSVSEQWEDDGVLKNKPGFQEQKKIDDAEALLLQSAYEYLFDLLHAERLKIGVPLLFAIHKEFLSPLYTWAGKTRTVNISKHGMLFAPVAHIPAALKTFESILAAHIPKLKDAKKKVAADLAIIHCEFNAIHPFREGNGRTIRLFLDLLADHAGYHPIDWHASDHADYIRACVDGMAGDYHCMIAVISAGLSKKR